LHAFADLLEIPIDHLTFAMRSRIECGVILDVFGVRLDNVVVKRVDQLARIVEQDASNAKCTLVESLEHLLGSKSGRHFHVGYDLRILGHGLKS
jgi:hypothetical protein